MRVGILTDFPTPTVQSGPSLHTKFLHDGLKKRGHDIVLMGPDTRSVAPTNGTPTHLYPAFSYPTHPNVKLSLPLRLGTLYNPPEVDVVHSQTNTQMLHYAGCLSL